MSPPLQELSHFQDQTRRLAAELQASLGREMALAQQAQDAYAQAERLSRDNDRLRGAHSSKAKAEKEVKELQVGKTLALHGHCCCAVALLSCTCAWCLSC